jgi:hypothetical protein
MHLTDEAILELAGKRLSGPDLLAVEEHIATCAQCSQRSKDLRFAHSVFARLAEVGLSEVAHGVPSMRKPTGQRPHPIAFPWAWVSGIVVSSVFLIAVFVIPGNVRQANASELLKDAMQSEVHLPPAAAYRIQIGEESCARGAQSDKLVFTAKSDRCKRAMKHLQASKWGYSNPLTAKAYAEWRNSLHQRNDRVTKGERSWEVATSTNEGEVREARLEMRVPDYHPTKLTLDFDDQEEVNISESIEPVSPVEIATAVATIPPKVHSLEVDDPVDLLEANAWSTLYKLGADSGWEGIVVRNGSQVEVEAIADNKEQKQKFLVAFAAYPEIDVKVHSSTDAAGQESVLPDRMRPDGDEAGLADGWLEQQFPDTDSRAKYSNQTLRYSRQILGRTFFLDQLQQREQALRRCSCAKELSRLVAGETRLLLALQGELSSDLQPLTGRLNHPPSRVLTFSQAQELDFDLGTIFFRSTGPDQAALNTRIQEIGSLLLSSPAS